MRARAVIDGQQVEIPVLRIIGTIGTLDQENRRIEKFGLVAKGVSDRQIHHQSARPVFFLQIVFLSEKGREAVASLNELRRLSPWPKIPFVTRACSFQYES